jgi:hypothetical protein
MAAALGVIVTLAVAMQHPAEPMDLASGERAQAAGRFVDSIGVNVHFSYRDTGYGNTARVTELLSQLGVRHLRDGVTAGQMDVCANDRALALKGYRFTYITQANPTSASLRTWASCTGSAVEAFEGLNEYDISHPASDAQWATTVRNSQHQLYRSVKGTPELATLPVVAPSLTSEGAFREVGDLSADLDVGNMHNYFSFHEPETNGWGLNGYGSLAFNMRVARTVDAAKPIESTETGYGTDLAGNSVDATTQAVYLPRLLLEQFAAGVPRTFSYELIDEGGAPFGHYGIVDDHLQPKPAFIALSSLIASLRDTAQPFQTGVLHYALDGAGDDVHHLLLQKRDGHFILALWIAAPSCDAATHAAREVSPQRLSVRINERLRDASVSQYGADWRLHRTALPVAAPLRLTVTDRVTLIEIVPAA